MDVGLVVEGQDGLTWDAWRRILADVERLGFTSLFRSDHFFIGGQQDSLEAYLSFVLAATETSRVRFGSLVTPVMFRTPVDVGRMAAQIDDLSGGRFVLGLGIGWYEDEHRTYGIAFPPVRERFDRLEEAISVCRALWGELPATFDGRFYRLEDAECRPKPIGNRVPILIGGVGEKRTLRIVARHADEWCSECLSVADYARKVEALTAHCEVVSRDPSSIRRSMVIVGDVLPSAKRVVRHAVKHALATTGLRPAGVPAFSLTPRAGGFLIGGRQQLIDKLAEYAKHGLQEAVFKVPDIHRSDVAEYLASEVADAITDL
jgi:F420-dependent oxidoreductase-like protein